jgi:hypothetical protein
MFRIFSKKFTDTNKLNEAKKKAMEMYEKMRNDEKIQINRKLEQEMLEKEKANKSLKDVADYKSEDQKKKFEEIFDRFNFIETMGNSKKDDKFANKSTRASIINENLNYYNKIRGDTLHYKLNEHQKNSFDKDMWLKIYEIKYDPNFEKLKNFLLKFLKIIIFYKSYFYIKKYLWNKEKDEYKIKYPTIKEGIFMLSFYSITIGLFIMNVGFNKRNISKIFIKDDKIRVFLYNNNKTIQNNIFSEIPIERLTSITSKSKTLHEILYFNEKNKVDQLFAPKNAFYDKHLLVNICHPNVKRINFTNFN